MKDLMIDLETLSTENNAVVLSLGAVIFDTETKKLGEEFYTTFNVDDQLKLGRSISADTLRWWLKQDRSTLQDALNNTERLDLKSQLYNFNHWIYQKTESLVKPWGNGATFDITILESLFKQTQIVVPWHFTQVHDMRTFQRFAAKGKKVDRSSGTHHNALDDARAQALFVINNC